MKKFLIALVVIVVLAVGAGAVLAAGSVGLRSGSLLGKPGTVTPVTGPQYLDKNVVVKVAQAEGKYAVAVAVLNQDVDVVMYEGDTKAYLTASDKPMNLDWTVDELTPERLANLHINVYAKGWSAVKKPVLALGFAEVKNPAEYGTIAEFKDYIQPPAE